MKPLNPTSAVDSTTSITANDLVTLAQHAKAQANAVLHKIPLLGQVCWLMMQQGATRHTLLSELEWRVVPALALDQCKLYMRDEAPVAFVSWAVLSSEVAARFAAGPHQLAPSEWRSADVAANGQVWIVDLFAPYGGAKDVIQDLRTTLFAGKEIRQVAPPIEGAAKVLTWPAVPRTAAP